MLPMGVPSLHMKSRGLQINKIINEKGCEFGLKQITKEQMEFLIKNKLLVSTKGRYQDLTITSRQNNSKRKKRYIPDNLYKKYFGKNAKENK
jgi:hypothetical protein